MFTGCIKVRWLRSTMLPWVELLGARFSSRIFLEKPFKILNYLSCPERFKRHKTTQPPIHG